MYVQYIYVIPTCVALILCPLIGVAMICRSILGCLARIIIAMIDFFIALDDI